MNLPSPSRLVSLLVLAMLLFPLVVPPLTVHALPGIAPGPGDSVPAGEPGRAGLLPAGGAGAAPSSTLQEGAVVVPNTTGAASPVREESALPPGVSDDWWATVQADLRRSEYYVSRQEEAYHALNRAHNLRAYFAPEGVRVIPCSEAEPSWVWELALASYGTAGAVRPVGPAGLAAVDNRIEVHYGPAGRRISGWYRNDERGLEQGFTLVAPAAVGAGRIAPLQIDLALGGDLQPQPVEQGRAVRLVDAAGRSILRWGELRARDAAGRELPAHFSLSPARLSIWVEATAAVYPVQVLSRIAGAPGWIAEGDQTFAHFGYTVGTAGDVNGDGYDDVIVGAPNYSNGEYDHAEGAVFVYYGGVNGPSTSPDWRAEGNQGGYQENLAPAFGHAVGTAGDVNGDGCDDVIVGAPYYDNGEEDEGAVFVWYGSYGEGLGDNGTPANADWMAESNQHQNEPSLYERTNFGAAAGTAGDVNGDGVDDIIVGSYGYDDPTGGKDQGAAFVWYGSDGVGLGNEGTPANADWAALPGCLSSGVMFGYSVGAAGNVNGDGVDDIIVGAPYWYVSGKDPYYYGKAFAWYGPLAGQVVPDDADWAIEVVPPDENLGWSVGTAGDANGDGWDDVIVGAPGVSYWNLMGRVYVYHGSGNGLSSIADWGASGVQVGTQFGCSVGTAGDLNGDGYEDVIIGDREYTDWDPGLSETGRALVYLGSSGAGLAADPAWTVVGDQEYMGFGAAVGCAGNVGGDGRPEIIIGVPLYDGYGYNKDAGLAYIPLENISRMRVEVAPATLLELNDTGWYAPNPLIYTVIVESEVETTADLTFQIDGAERLQAVPTDQPPQDWKTGSGWTCEGGGCAETLLDYPLLVGENHVEWVVWVQPMEAATLEGSARLVRQWEPFSQSIRLEAAAPEVQVPQAAVHPVVVVPGFMGTMPAASWGALDPFLHAYDALLEYLEILGYEPGVSLFKFPYNWSYEVAVTADLLDQKVVEIQQTSGPAYVDYGEVDLVTHSMGGLVARAYLEGADHNDDVHYLITVATPHWGVPWTYQVWEGADIEDPWLMVMLWIFAIGNGYCEARPDGPACLPREVFEFIQAEIISVRDNLPTADVPVPYLIEATTGSSYPYGYPQNPFLEDLNTPGGTYDTNRLLDLGSENIWAFYSLDFPQDTILKYRVQDCYDHFCWDPFSPPTEPLWLNGQMVGDPVVGNDSNDPKDSGDNLVPGYSAKIDEIPGLEALNNVKKVEQEGDRVWHEIILRYPAVLMDVVRVLTGVTEPPNPTRWPGMEDLPD